MPLTTVVILAFIVGAFALFGATLFFVHVWTNLPAARPALPTVKAANLKDAHTDLARAA